MEVKQNFEDLFLLSKRFLNQEKHGRFFSYSFAFFLNFIQFALYRKVTNKKSSFYLVFEEHSKNLFKSQNEKI